ncbi:MAG: methylated-DNA--[Firmicutes bacterium]|nr:methylated-DNA--[protein]-cysteine S-methyltransferase [Bacillota bacterium]
MRYSCRYETPEGLDDLIMISDGEFLTGLQFDRSKEGSGPEDCAEAELPVFEKTAKWLDSYFEGHPGNGFPAVRMEGLTPFRKRVLELVSEIPYGKTVTYGGIAGKLAEERGIPRLSPQAVGGAVGWNPVCILIPCHRVVGSDGSLTGYGGGIENKRELLKREKSDDGL